MGEWAACFSVFLMALMAAGKAENPRATSLFPPRAPSRPEQLERLRFLDKPSNQSNNVDKASFSIPTYTVSEGYTVISTRPSVHPLTSPLTHQHYLIFLLFVISTSALASESGNPTYADSRMGFFSSRKAEDNDNYQVSIGVTATAGASGSKEDKSVVRVIRSRFVSISNLTPLRCPRFWEMVVRVEESTSGRK